MSLDSIFSPCQTISGDSLPGGEEAEPQIRAIKEYDNIVDKHRNCECNKLIRAVRPSKAIIIAKKNRQPVPIKVLKRFVKRIIPSKVLLPFQVRRALRTGEVELSIVEDLCVPGQKMIDVGANVGIYSYLAKEIGAHVYAVEPNPVMAKRLQANVGNKVTVFPFALSDNTGDAVLSIPYEEGIEVSSRSSLEADANPGFEIHTLTVTKKTLDELELSDIAFIKIDVEGHELSVLRGATKALATCRPNLLIEIEERHHAGATSKAFTYLKEFSYAGYFILGDNLHKVEMFDPKRHQRKEDAKNVFSARNRNYINNFIFIHPSRGDVINRITARFPLC